ncbi:UNKNOWN [Stylonychia lemnae]|uniref:Uncharacterized protein n=1 Tax=Stylonychia lemnae TaxID=5949 RepID=A0A078ALF7_STYLE|nr:UNKNOWN [Stylonychia lemnae]|eukprot:CDW81693.1 UNKNOWN [Stylonychia lemnae]
MEDLQQDQKASESENQIKQESILTNNQDKAHSNNQSNDQSNKPKIPTVYPPNQPTIIIGPNSIRAVPNPNITVNSGSNNVLMPGQQIYPSLGSSSNERGNRRLREHQTYYQGSVNDPNFAKLRGTFLNDSTSNLKMMNADGNINSSNRMMDEYDDEDEDDYRDGEYGGQGFMNEMDFMTWDLIVKNTPKLAQIELLLHKNMVKNKKFFTLYNEYQYNPPFLIFYQKKTYKEGNVDLQPPQDSNIANFHEYLGVPHQCELVKFYEDFNLMKYPKNPIMMVKRKFFLVQYEPDLLHAVDGLGKGVIILPVHGNFLIKIYDSAVTLPNTNVAESYLNCIKPLMEMAALLMKN